jgi:hypothetical protein
MSPDRSTADRLNDHLDSIVTGGATPSPDLDPDLAASVARFFAADDVPAPPAGLADAIWNELMDPRAFVELGPPIPASQPNRNGRRPLRLRHIAPPNRGPSALTFLATAALLALTIVGSFIGLRWSLQPLVPEQRTIIPAIVSTAASALPTGVVSDDILLRATIEALPLGGPRRLGLRRIGLAPGAVEPNGSQADTGVGPNLFTVESGRVTVEADAPVVLSRAEANPAAVSSPVEPGMAIVLDVGDRIFAPGGVSFRRRNDGSAPATILEFSIGTVGDISQTGVLPDGVTWDNTLPFKLPPTFPTVPAEATVHRLTLAPGAELAVRDMPGLELVYVEDGVLELVYAKPEFAAPPEHSLTIRAGSGTETFGRTPERAVLANRGTEPLVLLTASIVPASAGEPTPQAEWTDGWGTGDLVPVSGEQAGE